MTVEPLEDKYFRKSEDVFLAVIIDFIPYKVSLILSILASEYWLQQLVSAFLRNVDNMYKSIYIYIYLYVIYRDRLIYNFDINATKILARPKAGRDNV